ncbi:MAG: hypothetical protein ACM3TN_10280 [Alphaproteobacteria bacterium]
MKVRFKQLLVALVLVSAEFAVTGAAEAAGQTAKAALQSVMATARKWQSDAVLVSLSTEKVNGDGMSEEWKYSFYSPASKKRFVATARGTKVDGREVRLGFSTEAMGDFVDSDRAMQEAKKNGLKGHEPSMAVKFQGVGKKAAFYWIVNGGYSKGDVSIFLDAKSGKFVNRSAME